MLTFRGGGEYRVLCFMRRWRIDVALVMKIISSSRETIPIEQGRGNLDTRSIQCVLESE